MHLIRSQQTELPKCVRCCTAGARADAEEVSLRQDRTFF